MSYIDNTLLPDETVQFRGHVHWIVFIPAMMLGALSIGGIYQFNQVIISGVLCFFSLLFFFRASIYFFTTELGVTNQRVIAKFGLIRRVTFELNLDRVMSLNVDQSILGRIFNYGDVFVNGMGGLATPIPVVTDPLMFRRWVLREVKSA